MTLCLGHLCDSAGPKAALLARAARALMDLGHAPAAPAHAVFVPGRIEVLGKHTDYAGGRSLIAAAEQGVCLIAVPRQDATVRAAALDLGDACEFPLSPDLAPTVGHWSNYPMIVARRVALNFPGRLRGADLALTADLPPAAGMSSSSALMVAVFLALARVNRLADRPEYRANIAGPLALAEYLGTVENGQTFAALAGDRGVGTFGGSEDHTAMLGSVAGWLGQYAYCPVRLERRVALPPGYTFAIASSGVAAEKTGAAMEKYNRASRLAQAVAQAWREATGRTDPHIAAALAGDRAASSVERMRQVLAAARAGGEFTPAELAARFEHFYAESQEIVPAAGDALAAGDVTAFGRHAALSQELAERLLGNQVPETVWLARAAGDLGAAAASAFGAGFGGSVWALVRESSAAEFLAAWSGRYAAAFPAASQQAAFFISAPGPAVFELGEV